MAKEQKGGEKEQSRKVIAVNKKARFEYHIIETWEAGLSLLGSEIKSIRLGHVNINESYIRPDASGLVLLNAHIREYQFSRHEKIDPLRPRRLLLHESEINKLRGRVEQKGLTIVPLSLYLTRGRAKLEIALAKGKDAPDKRDTVKEREAKRELARFIKKG